MYRSIIEDSYLVNKNEDFFCERKPSVAAKKANKKNEKSKKSKSKKKKKEESEEESSAEGEKSEIASEDEEGGSSERPFIDMEQFEGGKKSKRSRSEIDDEILSGRSQKSAKSRNSALSQARSSA